MGEGVSNITVSGNDDGIRLDKWFNRHYPKVPHIILEKALRKGYIRVDGKRVKSGHRVISGQIVRVPPLKERSENTDKPKAKISPEKIAALKDAIIYKDNNIIVINKPYGLAVQDGSKVKISLDGMLDELKFGNDYRPKLVHRLDKDTSGILLLARNSQSAAKLAEYFKNKDAQKIYWAVVAGLPKEKKGKINIALSKQDSGAGKEKIMASQDGKNSITYYRVLDHAARELSLVELIPVTGRTHQLRVHMAAIGHPIIGDGKYGGKKAFLNNVNNKMHLHARKITLPEFLGKKDFTIEADLPGHIKETLDTYGFSPSSAD